MVTFRLTDLHVPGNLWCGTIHFEKALYYEPSVENWGPEMNCLRALLKYLLANL
jgi:hypothetical protein